MYKFIKTKHGPYVSASEIAEINYRNRKSSIIRTKDNKLHIVEQENCMLAHEINFQSTFAIPAEPGFFVVEAICSKETDNEWGTVLLPVIGWNSIRPCALKEGDLFHSTPIVAGYFYVIGTWGLVFPDGRVGTEWHMYYQNVEEWLEDVKLKKGTMATCKQVYVSAAAIYDITIWKEPVGTTGSFHILDKSA